jgi:hypothetical protein
VEVTSALLALEALAGVERVLIQAMVLQAQPTRAVAVVVVVCSQPMAALVDQA